MLDDDIRQWFRKIYSPALGKISAPRDVHAAPDGDVLAFVGSSHEGMTGPPVERIYVLDVSAGQVHAISGGHNDACPRWSGDGKWLAYLSDGSDIGTRECFVVARDSLRSASVADVHLRVAIGTIEYLTWSPSGKRLLVGVAEPDADGTGGLGAKSLAHNAAAEVKSESDWRPSILRSDDSCERRSCFTYDLASGNLRQVSPNGLNVWEAAWAGDDELLAIVSVRSDEGGWYGAEAVLLDCTGERAPRKLYRSEMQVGMPSCSPSGRLLSIIVAICSDRGMIYGDLVLLPRDGSARKLDTLSVDVTSVRWCSDDQLLFAGNRGLESVIGEINLTSGRARQVWATREHFGDSSGPTMSLDRTGALYFARSGYHRYFEIVRLREHEAETLLSFAHAGSELVAGNNGSLEAVEWNAPDGRQIRGLLVRPTGSGPYPLILNIHGGPVGRWRNTWMLRYAWIALAASRGYALLHPEPRGSAGWGQEFISLVKGDVNGADTLDHLSGIDAMVERGIADPARIGVTGRSYGGNMTAWLVTQDQRFAAAVACAPHTDFFSFRYTSNVPDFTRLFVGDDGGESPWSQVLRSPVLYGNRVRTPVLQIAGALDRCCPPTQALEFHRAIAESGGTAELVIYPNEGHNIRDLAVDMDCASRMIKWFDKYMSP